MPIKRLFDKFIGNKKIFENQKLLTDHLIDKKVLRSSNIINAFYNVDRGFFVKKDNIDESYGDYQLKIGKTNMITQPTTVAFMLELLDCNIGCNVLEVGAGSGWVCVLLSNLVGKKGFVYGTEIDQEILEFGRGNIKTFLDVSGGMNNIILTESKKGTIGLPSKAPYDRVFVSAKVGEIPSELFGQLKIGGIMVIPVKDSIWKVTKLGYDEYDRVMFHGFEFEPLR